jgi:RNA polymerase sigma-70 factor (ECF subfamily)
VAHLLGRIDAAASLQPAQVNGYPALILRRGGQIDTVMAVHQPGRGYVLVPR